MLMKDFCEMNNYASLLSQSACFKDLSEPTIFVLILTIKRSWFQNSKILEPYLRPKTHPCFYDIILMILWKRAFLCGVFISSH